MDILVSVVNQKLRIATNLKNLVSGSQDFIKFIFDLSSDWDGMTTFAQFQQSGIAYNRSLDENNSVYLPQEIRAGTCKLTLYGSGNGRTGTTNYVTLYIDDNIFVYDAIAGDGIPEALSDRLSQIESSLRDMSDSISAKYTLPATGIPYNDLSDAVKQIITSNSGSGGGETIVVQGDTSTVYGFSTPANFNNFKTSYPNALKANDYVWIRDGDYTSCTYTLNVVNQNLQLSPVFTIGNTFVITVTDRLNVLSANKTLYQISTALNNGDNVVLRTEYGVVLNPTNYDANGIYFTNIADFNGVFYARTYSITSSGLSVNTRNLSEGTGFKVITVLGNENTGYTIDFTNSDFTSPSQLNQIINTDYNEDVRMKINGAVLPCVTTSIDSAQFSGLIFGLDSPMLIGARWDGNGNTITTFQIRTEDLALKSEIISGGGGSSSGGEGGSDITEATITAWGFIKNLQSKGYGYATNSQSASTTARTASLSGFVLTTGGNIVVKFTNSVPANATLNVNSTGAKYIRYRGANITSGIINSGDLVSLRYDGTYYVIESIDRSQYLVPSTGIPLSDLASSVQTSIEKADTAVQPDDLGDYVDKSALAAKTSAHTQAVTIDSSTGALYVLPPGEGGTSSTPVSLPSLGEARGICTTTGTSATKTVTLADYVLVNGNLVQIRFNNSVPASSTLNINSTGAKPIYYKGSAIAADVISSGDVALLTYNSSLGNNGAYNLITTNRAYLIPSSGIPGSDLAEDVQNYILAGRKLVATYNGLNQTLDATPAQLYTSWQTGNYICLKEVNSGDYEIPLTFINSTSTQAVFSGIIRDYNTGTAQSVIYLVSSDQSVTKTVTPIGGSGTGYTGPTITTPESSDVGKQLLAGTNGSTRWAAPEAPIRFTNTGSASSTSRTNTSISGFELVIGKKIVVKFNNGVPANCTLNVNSTGAKNIRYNGANITANTIKAGDEVTMVYDGNYYVVTNIDHVTNLVPTEATPSNQLADKSWVNTQIANSSGGGGSSGGGSATIETVTLTITAYQNSMDLSTALNYSNLSAKIQAGARFVSQMTVGNDQVNIEWTVLCNQTTQEIVGFYTLVEDANGNNLWVAYLMPTGGDEMSGEIETQLIGNAKAPKRTTKSGTSPAAFALYDNEIYTCGTVTSLTITSVASGAECILIFTSGSTPTNISLPSHLVFADGSPDVVNGVFVPSANYTYEINVSNRRALVSRWAVSA